MTWEGRTRRWMEEGTAAETPPTAWLGLCDSVGGLREIVGRRVVGWVGLAHGLHHARRAASCSVRLDKVSAQCLDDCLIFRILGYFGLSLTW